MTTDDLHDGLIDLNAYTITVPFEIDSTLFYSWVKTRWYHSEKFIKFPFPLGSYLDEGNVYKVFPLKPWGIKGIHNIRDTKVGVFDLD